MFGSSPPVKNAKGSRTSTLAFAGVASFPIKPLIQPLRPRARSRSRWTEWRFACLSISRTGTVVRTITTSLVSAYACQLNWSGRLKCIRTFVSGSIWSTSSSRSWPSFEVGSSGPAVKLQPLFTPIDRHDSGKLAGGRGARSARWAPKRARLASATPWRGGRRYVVVHISPSPVHLLPGRIADYVHRIAAAKHELRKSFTLRIREPFGWAAHNPQRKA